MRFKAAVGTSKIVQPIDDEPNNGHGVAIYTLEVSFVSVSQRLFFHAFLAQPLVD